MPFAVVCVVKFVGTVVVWLAGIVVVMLIDGVVVTVELAVV